MKDKFENESMDSMNKNPNNWKGIFYVNSKDPRIIVPKMIPLMGWTVNFGHKTTYIGMGLIILIIVAYEVFLAV